MGSHLSVLDASGPEGSRKRNFPGSIPIRTEEMAGWTARRRPALRARAQHAHAHARSATRRSRARRNDRQSGARVRSVSKQ